jgi:lipoate-protein ligase A
MKDECRATNDRRQLPVENGPVAEASMAAAAAHSSFIIHHSSFLLLDPPAAGAWNMAVDEALLEDAAAEGRCWLRFYRWQEPTLSLGYFQSYSDRRQHPASSHCPVVRRSSGGGAILHDAEVTYSLAVPEGHPLAANRLRTYRVVHEALVRTLARRGIGARILGEADRPQGGKSPFLCFQRRSRGDVLVGGDKIAGSAQKRCRGAVLQHGSVLLARSPRAPELLGLEELANQTINAEEFIRELLVSFEVVLAIHWARGEMSPSQRCRAATIAEGKYSAARWTKNR